MIVVEVRTEQETATVVPCAEEAAHEGSQFGMGDDNDDDDVDDDDDEKVLDINKTKKNGQ
jgi:hypothetical protein